MIDLEWDWERRDVPCATKPITSDALVVTGPVEDWAKSRIAKVVQCCSVTLYLQLRFFCSPLVRNAVRICADAGRCHRSPPRVVPTDEPIFRGATSEADASAEQRLNAHSAFLSLPYGHTSIKMSSWSFIIHHTR